MMSKAFARYILFHTVFLPLLLLNGCGEMFSEKPTEIESKNILRDLSQVTPSEDVNIPRFDVYSQPPKIVEGKVGDKTDAKLFYFTKYNTADKLAKLINEQFIKKFVDPKGRPYPVLDYNVSVNAPSNQLIVRCPTVEDAKQVLEFLENIDVPPIQVKIDCLISEVYADHTMDWETTIKIENLFGEKIFLSGKEDSTTTLGVKPAFPGAALRDIARSNFGLKTGYVSNEKFKALVDLLVSRGYLKILMNPTLEVVNGQTAKIETSEHVPLDTISNVHPVSGIMTTSTQYIDVVDSLEITPTVFADGYIGIKTRALIGSKSTPEGVKQTPIVTKREVKVAENRIREGQSLVIGGIRKTEKRSVVRGVPFLKDIPFLGILFSSKDFEERGKEVLFILTPTISRGGVPNIDIVRKIQKKHEMASSQDSIVSAITDPFGSGRYTRLVEQEAALAEVERIKAELEKSHAQRKSEWLSKELKTTTELLQAQKAEIERYRERLNQLQEMIQQQKQQSEQKLKSEADKTAKLLNELKSVKEQTEKRIAELSKRLKEAEAAKKGSETGQQEPGGASEQGSKEPTAKPKESRQDAKTQASTSEQSSQSKGTSKQGGSSAEGQKGQGKKADKASLGAGKPAAKQQGPKANNSKTQPPKTSKEPKTAG